MAPTRLARVRQHRVYRCKRDRKLLDAQGGETLVLTLQHVLIDFDRDSGVDSTARQILARLRLLADEHSLSMLVPAASGPICLALLDGGETDGEGPDGRLRFHETLDGALEKAENALLERCTELDAWLGDHEGDSLIRKLARYMEPLRLEADGTLFVQVKTAGSIYLVQSGRLDVHVRGDAGQVIRVRQVGAGSILGEVSVYLEQEVSASVIAREPSELLGLSRTSLKAMAVERPELASLFHQRMAALLA